METDLESKLSEIETLIPHFNLKNESISKSTVGWQLLHSLKVINMITNGLRHSNSKDFKRHFSILKLIIFNWGKIPRGAKAPKRVQVEEDEINLQNIHKQLEVARRSIKGIQNLPKNAFIEHPRFGKLNTKESIKFLQIHTAHHLKIVGEIIEKAK